MTLREQILERLAGQDRPRSASWVAWPGGEWGRLPYGEVQRTLGDLWEEALVDGYPEGPWSLAPRPVERQLVMGEEV